MTAPIDLGTLGGPFSIAYGVNSDGSVVVGLANTTSDTRIRRAFRWTSAGGMQDLTPGIIPVSVAYGVNSDGSVIVGYSHTSVGSSRPLAFRWTSANGLQSLGTLGGTTSQAFGVNSDGSVVVGAADTGSGAYLAFRRTSVGGMQSLGTLGGTTSQALGVSGDGSVVVGFSKTSSDAYNAFRWTSAGGMQDLGTLGGPASQALGVNSEGSVVVGTSQTTFDDLSLARAFRWTSVGGMQDLNALLSAAGVNMTGITLIQAYGVSSNGFIVGAGNFPSGANHAFIVRYDDGTGSQTNPTQQIAALGTLVQTFNVSQGIANSLDSKLAAVEAALDAAHANSTGTACNQLGAFINYTQAQSGKQLTIDQANQLLTSVMQIRATIGCS